MKKTLVFLAGSTLLLIGIALIFVPGPAFIIIPLGLGVLATEFDWAHRLLRRARVIARRQARRVHRRKHRSGDPAAPDSTTSQRSSVQ